VARRQREIETLAKPAFMVLLIALAWLHACRRGLLWAVPLGIGLVLSLIGDVLLLGDSDVHFLGSGWWPSCSGTWPISRRSGGCPATARSGAGCVLVVLLVGAVLWLRLVPRLRADWREGAPLVLYAVIIGAMAALAWATGLWVVGLGATLFLVSDTVLAYQRFEGDLPHGRLVVMVTYHLAQVLIVVGLLRC
jgi:uncharacterized membrane protein YhhN